MAGTVLEISKKIKKMIQSCHIKPQEITNRSHKTTQNHTKSQTPPPKYHSPTPKVIIHSYFKMQITLLLFSNSLIFNLKIAKHIQ